VPNSCAIALAPKTPYDAGLTSRSPVERTAKGIQYTA